MDSASIHLTLVCDVLLLSALLKRVPLCPCSLLPLSFRYVTMEKVLTAALPMLARLRRPALLLPGPLQVVVKSQRMLLEEGSFWAPQRADSSGGGCAGKQHSLAEYSGVWHIDGKRERIAAVVLYYYEKVNLLGGDLEFCDKVLPGHVRESARSFALAVVVCGLTICLPTASE